MSSTVSRWLRSVKSNVYLLPIAPELCQFGVNGRAYSEDPVESVAASGALHAVGDFPHGFNILLCRASRIVTTFFFRFVMKFFSRGSQSLSTWTVRASEGAACWSGSMVLMRQPPVRELMGAVEVHGKTVRLYFVRST